MSSGENPAKNKESVSSLLYDFAENTTMHGVRRVGLLEKRRLTRAAWLLLVFLTTGIAVYAVSQTVMAFFSYPVSTIVTMSFENNVEFPAITVCNLNRLRKGQYEQVEDFKTRLKAIEDLHYGGLKELMAQAKKANISIDLEAMLDNPISIMRVLSVDDISPTDRSGSTDPTSSSTLKPSWSTTLLPPLTSVNSSIDGDSSVSLEEEIREYATFFNYLERHKSNLMLAVGNTNHVYLTSLGHSLSSMLIDCMYQKVHRCSTSNFVQFYNQAFGNCYTFNKNVTTRKVTKSGPSHGLSLTLSVEADEYLKESQDVGFKIIVHPRNSMPFPQDEGVTISPGFVTSMAIMKMDIKRTPPPYSNCRVYGSKENLALNMYAAPPYETDYSDKACQKTCYQRYVQKTCGCCDMDFPCLGENDNLTYCDMKNLNIFETQQFEANQCLEKVQEDLQIGSLNCEDQCLPSCEETSYVEEVSMGVWPSEQSLDELGAKFEKFNRKNSLSFNYTDLALVRKNVAKVEIYYKQLNYERIETVPAYDWYRILADVGGQLGLWLGVSILTGVEFLELGFVIIRHLIRRLLHSGNNLSATLFKNGKADAATSV